MTYNNSITPSDTLQAALAYCKKGLSVIPVQQKGKRPLVEWVRYQTTAATEAKIREWWDYWPEANVGIVTGQISGIIVLDVDGEPGLDTIKRERLQIPPTLTSRTGGGGYHYIFKHPGGAVKNFARKLPGLDLRGDGGYIVAPPSVHGSGNVYEWLLREPPTGAPAWLVTLLTRESTGTERTPPARWLQLVQGACEGERNSALASLAGHLLRRFVNPHLTLELLLLWNESRCKPPLPEGDVRRTVDSVATAEAKRRGVLS